MILTLKLKCRAEDKPGSSRLGEPSLTYEEDKTKRS